MKRFAAILMLILCCAPARASDLYTSYAGGGSQDGSSGNPHSFSWLQNSANWGGGAGQIGPGVTNHLVGAFYADGFTVLGSGSGPTGQIVIRFDPGAYLYSDHQASTGVGIIIQHRQWVTIDGGGTNNGAIFCTNNGFALGNAANTAGVGILNSSFITVQNLAATNLYVPVSGQINLAKGLGVWIADLDGSGYNTVTVTNCLFHDDGEGVAPSYGSPNCSNVFVLSCAAYNCNWCVGGGDDNGSGTGTSLNGVTVSGCWFHDWNKWNCPDDSLHHNGIYLWAVSGGMLTNLTYCNNHIGPGFGGGFQTAGIYLNSNATNALIFNNVLDASDGSSAGNAFVEVNFNGQYSSSVGIYNNTFTGSANNGTGISLGSAIVGSAKPTYAVSNNLFSGLNRAIALYYFTNETTPAYLNCDYDLIYNCTTTPVSWGMGASSSPTSLAAWQSGGLEVHAQTGNPLLNSAWVPQPGSAASGAGANLISIFASDYYGASRASSPKAWDTGAVGYSVAGLNSALRFTTP